MAAVVLLAVEGVLEATELMLPMRSRPDLPMQSLLGAGERAVRTQVLRLTRWVRTVPTQFLERSRRLAAEAVAVTWHHLDKQGGVAGLGEEGRVQQAKRSQEGLQAHLGKEITAAQELWHRDRIQGEAEVVQVPWVVTAAQAVVELVVRAPQATSRGAL